MIHVIGNAAIDTIIRLERLPLPGETVIAEGAAEDLGGKGANQAVMIARCGLPVRLVAAIGDDAQGRRIRDNLAMENVMTDGLWSWPGPTDRCSIYVDRHGENTIVSLIGAAQAFDPLVSTAAADWIQDGDHVLFQGNLRSDVLRRCLGLARSKGAVTVLNPSPISGSSGYEWGHVDIAVMNRGEAEILGGSKLPREAAERLLGLGAGRVVVTLGSEGAMLLGQGEDVALRAPSIEPVDSTGAGDVLCGTLVAALAKGLSWSLALRVAVEAAACKVTRPGVFASFPSRVELERIFAETTGPQSMRGA